MNEQEIRDPEQLRAAILERAQASQEKLADAAEGRSMPFSVVVMLVVSFVMLALGIVSAARSEVGAEIVPALLGTVFLLSAMVMRLEGQLRASRALQIHSELRVTRLESSVFSKS